MNDVLLYRTSFKERRRNKQHSFRDIIRMIYTSFSALTWRLKNSTKLVNTQWKIIENVKYTHNQTFAGSICIE